ncbi:UNVERIFIED_CONTAM: Autophagy-related protein 18a [Sesamum angustifolium]|uniref:Autophagy-related protein 18a n=1 Tax=Sesamum angustifolium TaxID=2727405 RepID=A0AAW2K6F2_9LAMI
MASSSTVAGPTIRNTRNPDATPPPSILHLSFNHEGRSFAVGTTDGFMIFNTDPFVQTIRQDFSKIDQGVGIRIVQMILGTSKFAVVTTGLRRQKIMIWYDYDLVRQVNEVLYFRSEVKSVRVRPDRVVA